MTLKLVLLPLTVLALAGATGAYSATSCPRGQIFQVSKHVCIDRAEAVKLGILRGAAPVAPAAEVGAEPPVDAAPEAAPDPTPPAPKPRVKRVRAVPAKPAADEPELAASPPPSAPETTQTLKPANAAEKAATPFGVLDTGNVPAPLR